MAYQTFWSMREYRALLTAPHAGGTDDSINPATKWYGYVSYQDFVQSLNNPGVTYAQQIQEVNRLSQEVALQGMPHIADVRRVQSYGRSGHTVRWQALMQGNVGQAWKRTDVQQVTGRKSRVNLLLPGRFHSGNEDKRIMWLMVANVALAQALERKGTRCEIWTVCLGKSVWNDGTNASTGIRLKTSDSAWNMQDIVPIAHAAWFRRGIFRTWESLQAHHAGVDLGYGGGFYGQDLRQRLLDWGKHHELHTCLIGASEEDTIHDFASALAWLKQTVATLEKA